MKRDERTSGEGDPEARRSASSRSGGAHRQTGPRAMATDAGRSGYGSESVRPYLRAQLRLKELLGTPFIPPQPQEWPERKKGRW